MATERKFIVTTPSEMVRLDTEGHGNAIFTVTNRAGGAERVLVRAVPIGDTQAAWLSILGDVEREFPSSGSQQVAVSVDVPPGSAAGRYRFRLDLVSARRGGEDHEEGPAVSFEVLAVEPQEKRRWWVWVAAAALLAVVGVGAWLASRPEPQNPAPEPEPEPPPFVERVVLRGFWNGERGDNMTIATEGGESFARAWGYGLQRIEGYIFPTQQPGTAALTLFWNQDRGDFFTTATHEGHASAIAANYAAQRIEGWVYQAQQPGTVPLKLYWSQAQEDNYTTASADGEAAALASGYTFVRTEGYIFPSAR